MNFAILKADLLRASALNEQFVANLVLLRLKQSESVSAVEYAISLVTHL